MGMLVARVGVVAGQLLKQLPLLSIELGGQLHLDADQVVASGHRIAQLGHPLALQGEHRSGLGTGWNLQRLLAVHRDYLDGVAQNGLEVIERHLRVDVDAIAA